MPCTLQWSHCFGLFLIDPFVCSKLPAGSGYLKQPPSDSGDEPAARSAGQSPWRSLASEAKRRRFLPLAAASAAFSIFTLGGSPGCFWDPGAP